MGTPPVITPITAPTPPVPPAPPLVALLPQAASTLPTDAELGNRLRAMGTPAANAFIDAYSGFGNESLFAQKLAAALKAVDLPDDPGGHPLRPFLIHIARLGAEAFVLHVSLDGGQLRWEFLLGFIDHPDNLARGQGPQQEQFLHFAVRRLLELSSSLLTPDAQREQMDRTIVLFRFFQSQLGREFRIGTPTDTVLVAYRQLLFKIVQTHYQALMDGLLGKPGSGFGFSDALKRLGDHFQAITATDLAYRTPPKVPLYRIEGNKFRDYFNPAATSDFTFQFYSRRAPPVAGAGPEISFGSVIRKRHEQMIVLDGLRPGPHPVASASKSGLPASRRGIGWQQRELPPAQPEPPKLHDNASWQAWARRMWDTALMVKPTVGLERGLTGKLEDICDFVSRYFHAFTVHVPYDLAEGSKESNYLTRTYPRAITGCLAHDCVVYAIRWISILGRLFAPGSIPREISKPRIAIIEMPAHVGVMIRARLRVGGDVLIAANNQDAVVTEIDADLDDSKAAEAVVKAAEEVVEGMYPGLQTPIVKRDISANPSNATALWIEIAKMSDAKLPLPYDDPSEPFLYYLQFNAQNAAIAAELAGQVGERWRAMTEKLDAIKEPGRRRAAIKQELSAYRDAIEPLFAAANKEFETKVKPLAGVIQGDVEAHLDRIPRNAVVIETSPQDTAWQSAIKTYRVELEKAEKSLDFSNSDPKDFFPDDGFPVDFQ